MRSILALGFLIALCGAANAATAHHARRSHAVAGSNQGMIVPNPAPPRDSLGYTPEEHERFLNSVRRGG
jgi:hypothetical protein